MFDGFDDYDDGDDNFNDGRTTDLLNRDQNGSGSPQPYTGAGEPPGVSKKNTTGGKGFQRNTGDKNEVGDQKKTRPPREKLDFERLKGSKGIPDVFKTFRVAFKKQAKGRGHEIGDLGRLITMYERWHKRFFPYCDFDTFLQKVDKIHGKPTGRDSTGSNLKGDLQELRAGVALLAGDLIRMQQPETNDQEHQRAGNTLNPGNADGSQAGDEHDWDDDELDGLMRSSTHVNPAFSTQDPSGHAPMDDWDNDDLDGIMAASTHTPSIARSSCPTPLAACTHDTTMDSSKPMSSALCEDDDMRSDRAQQAEAEDDFDAFYGSMPTTVGSKEHVHSPGGAPCTDWDWDELNELMMTGGVAPRETHGTQQQASDDGCNDWDDPDLDDMMDEFAPRTSQRDLNLSGEDRVTDAGVDKDEGDARAAAGGDGERGGHVQQVSGDGCRDEGAHVSRARRSGSMDHETEETRTLCLNLETEPEAMLEAL